MPSAQLQSLEGALQRRVGRPLRLGAEERHLPPPVPNSSETVHGGRRREEAHSVASSATSRPRALSWNEPADWPEDCMEDCMEDWLEDWLAGR